MIIRTRGEKETKLAAQFREELADQGVKVFVVPHDVMYFFVTLDNPAADEHEPVNIIVQVMYEIDEWDRVSGFNSCQEAYDYARKLAYYAGLDEDVVDGDVYDDSMNIDKKKLANTTGFYV